MDLKSRLTLDGSDFSQQMENASESVNKFNKTTEDANKTIDDLGKSTKKSASELLNQMKSMEGLGRSTSNYRSQLAQMTRQIQDLTVNYRSMSDEMKNSDFGREVAAKIQELTNEASNMKDTIQDASASVKLLASDTSRLDAAKQGIQGLSAAFSLVASAGILGADSTEKMVKVMARLKAIESATNAVIQIANVLNKDSILMLKIKTIQTNMATRATQAQTSATVGATVAQKAFNTAAKANPYVLLASVILTVVGALTALTIGTNDDTEAQEKHAKAIEEQNRKYQAYANELSNVMVKYKQLQITWKELNSDMERENFIKEHKKDFDDLGISIENIDQAEKVLVSNTSDMVEVFALRAQAAAAASLAADAYSKALFKEQQVSNNKKQTFTAMSEIPEGMYSDYKTERAQKQGLSQNIRGVWYFTEKGAQAVNELNRNLYGVNAAFKEGDAWMEKMTDLLEQAKKKTDELGVTAKKTTENLDLNNKNTTIKTKVEPVVDANSLAAWQKKVQDIQNELNRMDPSNPAFQTLLDQLEEAKKKVKEIQDQMQRPVQFNTMEAFGNLTVPDKGVSLKQAEQQVNHLKSLLQDMDPDSILAAVVAKSLQEWEKKVDDIRNKYAQLGVTVEEVGDKQEETTYTMQDWYGSLNNIIGAFGSMNSGISSIYERWKGFEDAIDNKNPFETMLYTVDSLLSTLNSLVSIMQTIDKLQQLFNTFSAISLALKKKENAEKSKGIVLTMAENYQKAREAGLSVVAAIAEAIKSASNIPMVGWAIGLAAAAAVIGLIAAAPKFAKGGIVPGTSFSGDKVSAQLNSGEMVLNTQQQRNLFDMLNGKSNATGGQVEFVIKGQDLKGVLRNYDIKSSRI